MKKNQASYQYNNTVASLYLNNSTNIDQALKHKNEIWQSTIDYTNAQMKLKQLQYTFYQEKNNPKRTKSDEELIKDIYIQSGLLSQYKELYDSIDTDIIQTTREFCILNNYNALRAINIYLNGDSKMLNTLQKEWKPYINILPDIEIQIEQEETKMTAEEITNENLNMLKKYRRLRKE
jgi:hypothetical protein